MAALEFDHVSKAYENGVWAVRDLDLAIHDGEFVVLVGPSGCGKTTALRMLAGLEQISHGEIRVGGIRVNDVPPRERGDCYDNAVCESFHPRLEKELLRSRSFKTRQDAKTAIFDWIETWYNPARRHSRLGYRSPDRYEHDHDRASTERTDINHRQEEQKAA